MRLPSLNARRLAKTMLCAMLCATIGWGAAGFTAAPKAAAATEQSEELLSEGEKLIGTPYRLGSKSGSTAAFDCSSLTQYVFKQLNVKLPRTSSAQAKVGEKVAKGYLSKGDLLFFKTNGKSISHVGIYAGDNMMLHASSSNGVELTGIDTSYWKKRYVTARRVL